MLTWQSSNAARSVVPAWPVKVISYVRDRNMSHAPSQRLSGRAASVPGGGVCVSTLSRVIQDEITCRRSLGHFPQRSGSTSIYDLLR